MTRAGILYLVFSLFTVFSPEVNGRDRVFRWTIATDPYRNYIYPQQTGLKYHLSYMYLTESKSLRRYLKRKFDVRASASVSRIMQDVCSGVYFERYFDCKVKYLKNNDTLQVKVIYANGDTVTEKFPGGKGMIRFTLHLTRYKQQHDFSIGQSKGANKRGLVTGIDITVLSKRRNKGHVTVLSKLYTEADMPGILSRIKGKVLK